MTVINETSDRYQKIISDKILIAEDALVVTATIDRSKAIPQGGVYFAVTLIPSIPLDVLLCLVNSFTLSGLYKILFEGMHMGGGFLRFRTSFLEAIPSPPINEIEKSESNRIIKIVNKLISSETMGNDKYKISLESHLDAIVAHLYGLTLAEYTLILTDLKLSDEVRSACLGEFKKIAVGT
jgi:hypothetical protein